MSYGQEPTFGIEPNLFSLTRRAQHHFCIAGILVSIPWILSKGDHPSLQAFARGFLLPKAAPDLVDDSYHALGVASLVRSRGTNTIWLPRYSTSPRYRSGMSRGSSMGSDHRDHLILNIETGFEPAHETLPLPIAPHCLHNAVLYSIIQSGYGESNSDFHDGNVIGFLYIISACISA